MYIELLKEREQREHNRFLKCHFFNTFFYKKVLDFRFTYCMHKCPLKCWFYYIIFKTYGLIPHRKQKHCQSGFDNRLINGSCIAKDGCYLIAANLILEICLQAYRIVQLFMNKHLLYNTWPLVMVINANSVIPDPCLECLAMHVFRLLMLN